MRAAGVAGFCLWGALAVATAGQQIHLTLPPERIAVLIEHVRTDDAAAVDVQALRLAHATAAMPAMRERFAAVGDSMAKGKLAAALISLGDTNPVYWEFLRTDAEQVLAAQRALPEMVEAGSAAEQKAAEQAWLRRMHFTEAQGTAYAEQTLYRDPGIMLELAETGDPRAVPLLEQGLRHSNDFVRIMAATGLVEMNHGASVPLIVEAMQGKAEIRQEIARDLAWLDDPAAQAAARRELKPDEMVRIAKEKARGCWVLDCPEAYAPATQLSAPSEAASGATSNAGPAGVP